MAGVQDEMTATRAYSVELSESARPMPWPGTTPYEQWCEQQGIPVVRGFYIPDLTQVETAPWAAKGVSGAIIQLDGADDTNGSHVLKIDKGAASTWQHHIYEELYYVASGSGAIELRGEGPRIERHDWAPGAVFAPPLNVPYRLIANTDATLYCVSGAPPVMNLFHNAAFHDDNPFVFADRVDVEAARDYFDNRGRLWKRPDGAGVWETTWIDDVNTFDVPRLEKRGGDGRMVTFQLGDGSLIAHISQFPSGQYKKAHRHGPGANIVILGGRGYSLLWQHDGDDPQRLDWGPNSIFVPPDMWWHQHFNSGTEPARYVALRWGSRKHMINHKYEGTLVDRREGGNQIEYDEQAPYIDELFAAECARNGATFASSHAS